MKIGKVINSNIGISFEPNFNFFLGLFVGALIGFGLIHIF